MVSHESLATPVGFASGAPFERLALMNALDRVRKLLELAASSPSIEEARNAGVQAAKLIKEHGLVVVEGFVGAVRDEFHAAGEDLRAARVERSKAQRPPPQTPQKPVTFETASRSVGEAAGRAFAETLTDALSGAFRPKRRR